MKSLTLQNCPYLLLHWGTNVGPALDPFIYMGQLLPSRYRSRVGSSRITSNNCLKKSQFLFFHENHSPFAEIRRFETEIGDLRESCRSVEIYLFIYLFIHSFIYFWGGSMVGTWRYTRDYLWTCARLRGALNSMKTTFLKSLQLIFKTCGWCWGEATDWRLKVKYVAFSVRKRMNLSSK